MSKKRYYEKYEFRAWKSDYKLGKCHPATRGIWADWLATMMDDETYYLTGTLDDLATAGRCKPEQARDAILDLERTNAATVGLGDVEAVVPLALKNVTVLVTPLSRQNNAAFNGIITVLNRKRMRDLRPKEKNRLRQEKFRSKPKNNADVTPYSNSKSKEVTTKVVTSEREEDTHSPGLTPSAFEHPAVVLYEEKFHVKVRTNFAREVVERVTDLGVWTKLISDKIAFADKDLKDRQNVANWILIEYDKRLQEKQNGTRQNIVNFREQRAQEVVRTRSVVDAARERNRARDEARGISGQNSPDSPRQLRGVVEDADTRGNDVESGDVDTLAIQHRPG